MHKKPSCRRRRHGAPRGIHDLTIHPPRVKEKSWMPACAGMTLNLLESQQGQSRRNYTISLILIAALHPALITSVINR